MPCLLGFQRFFNIYSNFNCSLGKLPRLNAQTYAQRSVTHKDNSLCKDIKLIVDYSGTNFVKSFSQQYLKQSQVNYIHTLMRMWGVLTSVCTRVGYAVLPEALTARLRIRTPELDLFQNRDNCVFLKETSGLGTHLSKLLHVPAKPGRMGSWP